MGRTEVYVLKKGEKLDKHPYDFENDYIHKTLYPDYREDPYLEGLPAIKIDLYHLSSATIIRKVAIEQRMVVSGSAMGVKPRGDDIIGVLYDLGGE